jgi:hypothetical protein
MSTFGKIKTKIENTAVELAKKPNFKRFIFEFKSLVLNNKDMSELYYIYDDLSSNKELPQDLANDYINESIEYSQVLIESQNKNIDYLNQWINSWNKSNINNYTDIDNVIYNNNIRNLESVLESKSKIKNTLISENNKSKITESIELPLSSVIKIANENLKNELSSLNESEKKELENVLSLNFDDMKKEFLTLKENVIGNLKNTLNESAEKDIDGTINKTIEKIMDAKCNYYDYYKLKKLSLGL